MYFNNCLPFLLKLAGRRVLFLSPLPRYVYSSCCGRDDHNTSRHEDDFEGRLREDLATCRNSCKDLLFTGGLRGFKVINPGLCIPREDEAREPLWRQDPVHPTYEGYSQLVDFLEAEAENLRKGAGKRAAASPAPPQAKRFREDRARPHWIEASSSSTISSDWRGGRGGRPGRGGWSRRPWVGRGRGDRGRGSGRGRGW